LKLIKIVIFDKIVVIIFICWMSPIFKCLICRKDIERSTKTFWVKKGHLLCSTCLDKIDSEKNLNNSGFKN